MSAYLFIFVLEIDFLMIKAHRNINSLNIFCHDFLYTAHTDGTTFLIRNKNSVIQLLNIFDTFSVIYGLMPNKSKWKIAGIGSLTGVYVELCG